MGITPPTRAERAVLILSDGTTREVIVTEMAVEIDKMSSRTEVEITGFFDQVNPLQRSVYGAALNAGGDVIVLRCPKCDALDEGHDCNGPTEAPAVEPQPRWGPPRAVARMCPEGILLSTGCRTFCIKEAGHGDDHITAGGTTWPSPTWPNPNPAPPCSGVSPDSLPCIKVKHHTGQHLSREGQLW